jgi:hypothetical protein
MGWADGADSEQKLTVNTPCIACLLADPDLWTTGGGDLRGEPPCLGSPGLTCLPVLNNNAVQTDQTREALTCRRGWGMGGLG